MILYNENGEWKGDSSAAIWKGTKAQWEAGIADGTITDNTVGFITDEGDDSEGIKPFPKVPVTTTIQSVTRTNTSGSEEKTATIPTTGWYRLYTNVNTRATANTYTVLSFIAMTTSTGGTTRLAQASDASANVWGGDTDTVFLYLQAGTVLTLHVELQTGMTLGYAVASVTQFA